MSTTLYSTVISPNDHMWATGEAWYFEVGLSALDCVNRALAQTGVTPRAILDMPCGHGRVCRMLRASFPSAAITVCDLDRDGVDFCASEFHAEPLYSDEDVRNVKLDRLFDLIWCGSLFTHLDRGRWPAFLEFFAAHLAPGGVLVFTTHGRRPIQWMLDGVLSYGLTHDEQRSLVESYASDGFGYVAPANQPFGISLSSLSFVCAQIERQSSLKLVGLHEAGWADHQDVAACVRLVVPFPAAVFTAPAPTVRQPDRDRPMGHLDAPAGNVSVGGRLPLSGWAGDERGIREVRVLLDGQVIATPPVSVERPDVSAVFPTFRHGHDRHGWLLVLDIREPGPHAVTVQAENIDGVTADLGARVITVRPDGGPTVVPALAPGDEREAWRRRADEPYVVSSATFETPVTDAEGVANDRTAVRLGASADASLYRDVHSRQWFYDFDLPDGSSTESYLHPLVAPIHPSRLEMMWRALDPVVGDGWREFTAIDVACHQGFFASHLARRGCRRVLGVDARAEHVEAARLIASVYGLTNMEVEQRDVRSTAAADLGTFDIVVVFGLLYHVENPVGLLRLARALTGRVCVIETQVAPPGPSTVEWGSRLDERRVAGTFSIVDETGLTGRPESNLSEISLCPSLDALLWVMRSVGFARVEVVPPGADAYEQLARGARVMAVGHVD